MVRDLSAFTSKGMVNIEGVDQKIAEEQRMIVKNTFRYEGNELVIDKLADSELESEALPPSEWAIGTGSGFQGDITSFKEWSRRPSPLPSEML